MPVLLMLLVPLLRNLESFLPAPLSTMFAGAPLQCQVEVCFVATLSQQECVGDSVTSTAVRCALCKGQVYTQVNMERERDSAKGRLFCDAT